MAIMKTSKLQLYHGNYEDELTAVIPWQL